MFFRMRGEPVILVRLAAASDMRAGGLWFGIEPIGEIEIGGVSAQIYKYIRDGISTIAYVVPRDDQSLALEFRSSSVEVDKMRARVLGSVQWGDDT